MYCWTALDSLKEKPKPKQDLNKHVSAPKVVVLLPPPFTMAIILKIMSFYVNVWRCG